MDVDTGTLFLALLSVAAEVAVALVVVVALTSRSALRRVRDVLGEQSLQLAFVVALVSTVGSLWLSEGAHFTPCRLCWYQRIAMYPMAVVLGVAAFRRAPGEAFAYAIVLPVVGVLVSIYHVWIENHPNQQGAGCKVGGTTCATKWIDKLGYI
ncbi:MAG: hypothetical protein V7636_342, partial [Actinomycetota bacterium]